MPRTYRSLVRSKSEVIVAATLTSLGISWDYELKLPSRSDANDYRLPDVTVHCEVDTYCWERLGMLSVPSYKGQWERTRFSGTRRTATLATGSHPRTVSMVASTHL